MIYACPCPSPHPSPRLVAANTGFKSLELSRLSSLSLLHLLRPSIFFPHSLSLCFFNMQENECVQQKERGEKARQR